MAWLAQNGSSLVVLLILVAIVGAILRSMIKNKTLGCDGCSGECAGCGAACGPSGTCPTFNIELTAEQQAELETLRQRNSALPGNRERAGERS